MSREAQHDGCGGAVWVRVFGALAARQQAEAIQSMYETIYESVN